MWHGASQVRENATEYYIFAYHAPMTRLARYTVFAALLFGTAFETASAQVVAPPIPGLPPGSTVITPSPPGSVTPPTGDTHTQASGAANVTVNVTPPPPDPQAVANMYDYSVASAEHSHASVPVNWATGLLSSDNIWTSTPWSLINIDTAQRVRNAARNVALSLFVLGILWTGMNLLFGQLTSTTTYQQLLPAVMIGFILAMYSENIAHRMVDLCNWLNVQLGDPTMTGFVGQSLAMPERPALPTNEGIVGIPASFFSGLASSLLMAIILLILELKLIFRDGILIVTTAVMPLSGILYAFSITRGWGQTLYRLFFGWLFGQPLVVVCLAISASVMTFFNNVDSGVQVLVKLVVAFIAIKALTIFAGGGLGSGSIFGLGALLMLMRRMRSGANNVRGAVASAPEQRPLHVSPANGGTGSGTAATARPWRPSFGTA